MNKLLLIQKIGPRDFELISSYNFHVDFVGIWESMNNL